jgi:putative transposase
LKYELKSTRHAKYLLHAHIIFTPKYRKKIFIKEHLDLMKTVFEGICKMNDATLEEFDGEADHVHLLVLYPPRIALSVLVNSIIPQKSRQLLKKSNSLQNLPHQMTFSLKFT